MAGTRVIDMLDISEKDSRHLPPERLDRRSSDRGLLKIRGHAQLVHCVRSSVLETMQVLLQLRISILRMTEDGRIQLHGCIDLVQAPHSGPCAPRKLENACASKA